jgi:hypothetical protein
LTYQKGELGDGVIDVLSQPRLPALRRLELERIGCTTLTAMAIASRGAFSSRLEQLSLSGNPIGSEGVRALAQSPKLDRLEWLGVFGCGVTEKAGLDLAKNTPSGLKRIFLEEHEWSKAAQHVFLARFPKRGVEPPTLAKPARPAVRPAPKQRSLAAPTTMTIQEAEKAAVRFVKSKGYQGSTEGVEPVRERWRVRVRVWKPSEGSEVIKLEFDANSRELVRVDARRVPKFPKA